MKKLMIAAAAAVCGSVFALESANVVGYQNVGFDKSGWMMNVGVQFSNIGAEGGAFTLADSFFGNEAAEGDQVIALDADAWNLSQWDKLAKGEGWMLTPADGGDFEFVDALSAKKGDLVYYIPSAASELTVAGEVAQGSQSVTFDPANELGQWMFPLANPFPIDTTWGDLNTFTKEGDQLIALDGDAWNLSQYDRLADGEGWMLTPADGGEFEFLNNEEDVVIPAGGAMYYIPVEAVTWTVTL